MCSAAHSLKKKPHYPMAFALAKFHTCFCIQWFYSQIFIKKNIPLILTTTRKLIKLYSNAFSFKIHLINKATVPSICKNIHERFIKSHIEQNQVIQIIKWQHWRFYFYKTKSFWNSFNFISGRFLSMDSIHVLFQKQTSFFNWYLASVNRRA